MSVRNGFVFFLALSMLSLLVACGSSSPKAVPPPSGGFTNSDLTGTYVFSTSGSDSSAGAVLDIVGDFVASGGGAINGGAVDVADGASGIFPNETITGGTYDIGVDGRGLITLNTSNGTITLDVVLTSSTHGLVTEFDSNGSGSGTLDLQAAAPSQAALTGLTFGLTGFGPTASFATVGTVTLNSSGFVTAGFEDFNSGATPTTNEPVSTSSYVTLGTGTAPGTAQFTSGVGTFAFDVYAIDSTRLKFIETDGFFITSGDAFTPGTSLPASSALVFTMAGADTTGGALAVGGILPLDANSNIANGVEDFNDNGAVVSTATTVGGGFSPISGGRSVLTLTSFVNGASNDLAGTYTFAAYPFTSNGVNGVELLEIDSGIVDAVTVGTGFAQTGTTLATSQGYGLNLTGFNSGGEEDDIAEFVTSSTSFSGLVDLNDQGSTTYKKTFTGTFPSAVDATGRGAATTNYFNYNFYVVNAATFLLLETDSTQVGIGIFEQQTASGIPGAAARSSLSVLRPQTAHASMRRKK